MSGPDGSFTVTLADVYAEVRRCQDAIWSMKPQAEMIHDHEGRIRSLERWRYGLPLALIIAAGSAGGTVLLALNGR